MTPTPNSAPEPFAKVVIDCWKGMPDKAHIVIGDARLVQSRTMYSQDIKGAVAAANAIERLVQTRIALAVAEEREACANECGAYFTGDDRESKYIREVLAARAEAIRARAAAARSAKR